VTEDEMKEKFLNEYNSFESEYILFDSAKEAEDLSGGQRRTACSGRIPMTKGSR